MMHTICVADGLYGIASFHEAGWFVIYQYRDREPVRKMRAAVKELTDEKRMNLLVRIRTRVFVSTARERNILACMKSSGIRYCCYQKTDRSLRTDQMMQIDVNE